MRLRRAAGRCDSVYVRVDLQPLAIVVSNARETQLIVHVNRIQA